MRWNSLRHRFTAASAIMVFSVLLSGCVKNPGDTQNLDMRFDTVKVRSREETLARQSNQTQMIRIRILHNMDYVALPDLARATGYHGAWVQHGRAYGIGDHDVVWTFRIGDSRVTKAGTNSAMPAPAVLDRGLLYVPVSGLQPLFGQEAMITGDSANLSVLPRSVSHETGTDGSRLNFADASGQSGKNRRLIEFAKQRAGARYEFGAGPYEASGTFDCSSFTQYVMKHNGVSLPRTAIEQAKLGKSAARDRLQAGDLLFFYIPGRYKSHAMVGHVGIYMGGGRMIHANPEPHDGVQITDVNRADWKRQFLYAKRILP